MYISKEWQCEQKYVSSIIVYKMSNRYDTVPWLRLMNVCLCEYVHKHDGVCGFSTYQRKKDFSMNNLHNNGNQDKYIIHEDESLHNSLKDKCEYWE